MRAYRVWRPVVNRPDLTMNEPNDDLGQVLREWRSGEPLPARFQEGVWRRIEWAERVAPGVSAREWFVRLFARPVIAAVYMAVLLVMGLGAGYFLAGHDAARWEGQLSSHYVASINPYADKP